MRFSEILTFTLLQASTAWSSPLEDRSAKVVASKRPNHAVSPYHPRKSFPLSPERKKTCVVKKNTNGTDDSQNILNAIKNCNNGGHVVFPKDQKFTIGTALDLTFLKHIDLGKPHKPIIQCIVADSPLQISKVPSSSQTIPTTGKRMHSSKFSKMPRLSSS